MGKIGRVVQIIGPVLDIEFEDDHLPTIFNAVHIVDDGASTGIKLDIIAEVEQHLSKLLHEGLGVFHCEADTVNPGGVAARAGYLVYDITDRS